MGFGIGLSPWPEDFALCNEDWATRGPRMDEMIEILRRLEDKGVTDVIVGFRNVYTLGPDTQPFQHKRDALRRYADDVIAKV